MSPLPPPDRVWSGRLVRRPFPGAPVNAGFAPPQLASEADFAAYADFATEGWAPVLVSFPQRHALMDAIVGLLEREIGAQAHTMLVTCRVPSGGAMPARLGAEHILNVVEPEAEARRLNRLGLSFLIVREGFIRYPMERGDNRLSVAWFNAPEGAPALAALTAPLAALGVEQDLRAAA